MELHQLVDKDRSVHHLDKLPKSTQPMTLGEKSKQASSMGKLPTIGVKLPARSSQLATLSRTSGNQTEPEEKLPSLVTQLPAGSPQLATSPTTAGKQTVREEKLPSPVVDLPVRSPQLATSEVMPARTAVRHVGPVAKLLKTNLTLPSTHLQGDALPKIYKESQAIDLLSYDRSI